jgi:WD40 repeat protein
MRSFYLGLVGCFLFAAASPADEPAGKDQPKDGPKVSAEQIDRLIVQLGDDDTAKRAEAKKQLEAAGQPAVAGLKKAAESAEDPEVRKAAQAMLEMFDAKARGMLHMFEGHGNRVNGVAISADGKRAVSASWDGNLRYWDLDDNTMIRQIAGNGSRFNSVALSPDGKRLLSGGGDRKMRLWDLGTGVEVRAFAHLNEVWDVTFSPDGKTALSACQDGGVRLWALESGATLQTMATEAGAWAAAFTSDGKHGLTGNGLSAKAVNGPFLRMWDLATGTEIRQFEGHTKDVRHVAISPDGKQLLSASFDGTVRLWELQTGKELKKFDGPGNFVESVSFTPDGKRAVCSYGPATARAFLDEDPRCSVKLWDLATGKEIKQFKGHGGPILSLAVSGDGRRLVSGSADKTMRVWELPK